jgi:hypothetical protein
VVTPCGGLRICRELFSSDLFETSSRLAFHGSLVNIDRMTLAVITFANLWWRSI